MAKILIVEDDNNLREIYGARLEAEGYTVVGASDGEEALAIAIREQPDLIISDVMMPKISGFDMLDILRSTPETKNVKVIVMTALSQDEDRRRGEQLGADRYVVKSQVTLDDVVSMVEEIIASIPTQPEAQPPISPVQSNPEMPQSAPISPGAPTTQAETPPPQAPLPNSQPSPEYAAPQSQPANPNPNPNDENELVKEVENFVATSPLMNGVPPSSLSEQVVTSPGNPIQVAQIDNPSPGTDMQPQTAVATEQQPSIATDTVTNNDSTS